MRAGRRPRCRETCAGPGKGGSVRASRSARPRPGGKRGRRLLQGIASWLSDGCAAAPRSRWSGSASSSWPVPCERIPTPSWESRAAAGLPARARSHRPHRRRLRGGWWVSGYQRAASWGSLAAILFCKSTLVRGSIFRLVDLSGILYMLLDRLEGIAGIDRLEGIGRLPLERVQRVPFHVRQLANLVRDAFLQRTGACLDLVLDRALGLAFAPDPGLGQKRQRHHADGQDRTDDPLHGPLHLVPVLRHVEESQRRDQEQNALNGALLEGD